MTKEEYFRKNYPDSCYGDRPLSPYWDFFEEGVEFGERQSEKKIEELKEKHKQEILDLVLSNSSERAELEKENTELTETLKTYNGCGDWDNDFHTCRVYLQHEELQEYIDQLTKAKEIIKEFVCHYNNKTIYVENMNPLLQRAEQFIKGCSE